MQFLSRWLMQCTTPRGFRHEPRQVQGHQALHQRKSYALCVQNIPWYNGTPMDTTAFLSQIRDLAGYRDQVVHVERLPARRARYGSLDLPLPPVLQSAVRDIGADRLYTHQAQAINAARQGLHVILATGTASGKTLAYIGYLADKRLLDRVCRGSQLVRLSVHVRSRPGGRTNLYGSGGAVWGVERHVAEPSIVSSSAVETHKGGC